MGDWTVGQQVVIVSFRRLAVVEDGVIVKIGRKWITVKHGSWGESRFDFDGRGDHNYGSPPRLYPSREEYTAQVERRQAWSALHSAVRQSNSAPAHLSTQQIADIHASIFPTPFTKEMDHGED